MNSKKKNEIELPVLFVHGLRQKIVVTASSGVAEARINNAPPSNGCVKLMLKKVSSNYCVLKNERARATPIIS